MSEYAVSTAWHCVSKNAVEHVPLNQISVVLPGGNQDLPYFKVTKVEKFGKDSTEWSYDNDKVVIYLSEPIPFSETRQAAKIGDISMLGKYELFAIGHGRTNIRTDSPTQPVVGKMNYLPKKVCGPPGFSIATGKDVDDPPEEITPVISHGDSGGGLYAYVPADDPDYEEGYYFVGIAEKICGIAEYNEYGNPIPDYLMGFQSVVHPEVQQAIAEVIAK
ncbi:MAG: Trypsin, partial [Patescibacteria group bacterium]|nr:Trypsin [Patescibacteria group bacterium]